MAPNTLISTIINDKIKLSSMFFHILVEIIDENVIVKVYLLTIDTVPNMVFYCDDNDD